MTTFPAPVPKPASPGAAQPAIALTRLAYANVRNGPGTSYRDIGDLRKYSLVAYYPATRTRDGWVWIEQFSMVGWVSTSVVDFEHVTAPPPLPPQQITPYLNHVAVWHWRGDSVSENTIDELAQNLKRNASHVTQVWVKSSDYTQQAGAQWMGYWDSKRNLAIDGPASIDRWVETLAKYGLELHLWMVPRGADIEAEARLIIQACTRPGVRSLILDVEPYAGFWLGGRDAIRPLMTRVRRAIPATFHLGICVDPRSHHYATIYPEEWQPFINSIHPMVYWETMRRTPEDVLEETYRVWGSYGKPIIPILQGNSTVDSIRAAHTLATQRYHAQGLSWWRLGVIGPVEWQAVNQPVDAALPPQVPDPIYTDEQVIKPTDAGFKTYSYTGRDELSTFIGAWGWSVYYKKTESRTSQVVARWTPKIPVSGQYEVAAFIPARHATTANARYKLHGVKDNASELLISVDQTRYRDQWATLGVFDLDKDAQNVGVVYLNDLTGETDREIAFDALRWRRVINVGDGGGVPEGFADGFDPPIGTDVERRGTKVWPGQWIDASPFGRLYFVGTPSEAYHTGADLNLPADADRFANVYATAAGTVTFAASLPVWGNVIVIRHDPLVNNGLVIYSRSAHLDQILVKPGDRVKRGTVIGKIGNAFGRWAYHLHFDLSATTILETNPGHWPGKNRDALFNNYIDPREFINTNRPK